MLSVFTAMIIGCSAGAVPSHHCTRGVHPCQRLRVSTPRCGAEVGKVAKVTLIDGDAWTTVDRSLLDQATTARSATNLIGDRYSELGRGHSGQWPAPGATDPARAIPIRPWIRRLLGGVSPTLPNDLDKVNKRLDHHRVPVQGANTTTPDEGALKTTALLCLVVTVMMRT